VLLPSRFDNTVNVLTGGCLRRFGEGENGIVIVAPVDFASCRSRVSEARRANPPKVVVVALVGAISPDA
jgi:hypothetical protein